MMMMSTSSKSVLIGFHPNEDSKLAQLGRTLLEAALAYRAEFAKADMVSAVVWTTYPDGELVIVTRGEYRDMLMENIEQIARSKL